MPWTFRAENSFLPTDLRVGEDLAHFGRAIDEIRLFLEAGVDGLFCDHPDIGVVARADFLGGL
jgi:glycerophosphoryl diester phosphodiesterase